MVTTLDQPTSTARPLRGTRCRRCRCALPQVPRPLPAAVELDVYLHDLASSCDDCCQPEVRRRLRTRLGYWQQEAAHLATLLDHPDATPRLVDALLDLMAYAETTAEDLRQALEAL